MAFEWDGYVEKEVALVGFFPQMLQAASSIAPRGVYVCGNTTTMSGLTVTLVKEGGTGEYSLEAGALVLGDQGKPSCSLTLTV